MSNVIKIGNLTIDSFKVGAADCSIYLGTTKLYPQGEPPTPTFSGLTVYYNISDISQPTYLFYAGSGSGSGSGSGGVLPSAMIIDGTEVEVTNTYQFSTTGKHIVNYSFAENQVPNDFILVGGVPSLLEIVRKVEIGDAITSIGQSAFNGCENITAVTIGNSVTSIGDTTFGGCISLTNVTIPNSVTNIDNFAFSDCTGLTSVTIGSGVTSIGNAVFLYCTSLTSITIPDSVTSIGSSAFNGCTSLTSITSNATTAPTIDSTTFENIKTGGTLYVPSGSSGYDTWMQHSNYYLGLYSWDNVEQ